MLLLLVLLMAVAVTAQEMDKGAQWYDNGDQVSLSADGDIDLQAAIIITWYLNETKIGYTTASWASVQTSMTGAYSNMRIEDRGKRLAVDHIRLNQVGTYVVNCGNCYRGTTWQWKWTLRIRSWTHVDMKAQFAFHGRPFTLPAPPGGFGDNWSRSCALIHELNYDCVLRKSSLDFTRNGSALTLHATKPDDAAIYTLTVETNISVIQIHTQLIVYIGEGTQITGQHNVAFKTKNDTTRFGYQGRDKILVSSKNKDISFGKENAYIDEDYTTRIVLSENAGGVTITMDHMTPLDNGWYTTLDRNHHIAHNQWVEVYESITSIECNEYDNCTMWVNGSGGREKCTLGTWYMRYGAELLRLIESDAMVVDMYVRNIDISDSLWEFNITNITRHDASIYILDCYGQGVHMVNLSVCTEVEDLCNVRPPIPQNISMCFHSNPYPYLECRGQACIVRMDNGETEAASKEDMKRVTITAVEGTCDPSVYNYTTPVPGTSMSLPLYSLSTEVVYPFTSTVPSLSPSSPFPPSKEPDVTVHVVVVTAMPDDTVLNNNINITIILGVCLGLLTVAIFILVGLYIYKHVHIPNGKNIYVVFRRKVLGVSNSSYTTLHNKC